MIRNLRHKFIAIAMLSTALVLILIIGAINIINYRNVNLSADELLDILAQNDGQLPKDLSDMRREPPDDGFPGKIDDSEAPPAPKNPGGSNDPGSRPSPENSIHPKPDGSETDAEKNNPQQFRRKRSSLTAEAAYNTRYFTVTLNEDGSVYAIDTGKIHATDSDQAAAYAAALYEKGTTDGFVNRYKYTRITKSETTKTRYLYIFLDCEQDLTTFRNFLIASILISIAGLLIVFILVVVFSGKAVKPVAESYAKQKRFITDAGHEIKTPLTIIDANTEILEMMGEENEWTRSIRNQIRRLTDLTEKMVFLSRMDEENSQFSMLDFSLSDAVADTVEPFLAVAQTRGLTLTLSVEPDICCHGDEGSIRQVISLLVDNALKYCSESGQIRVTLSGGGRNCRLMVWNTVDEIEPGSQDMLFDRFYRRDSSRSTKTGGQGIGLSVAQAIVLAHRGKISAKSEDGTSIIFRVTLPAGSARR